MPALFDQPCGCDDCQAAVSPAAYLATLLDYALKHVRMSGNSKIDPAFLVNAFHQPFTDLPTDCEAVDRSVRQVRMAIEVLRSYLGNRPLADVAKETTLAGREADYAFVVYSMLLDRIGSSYEEVRRARSETAENRKSVTERLGIGLTTPRPADVPNDELQNGDELDQLFLDLTAMPPNDHLLTEQAIERLFGLSDTTRDPLSEGAKFGDDQNQLTRWNLSGVIWGFNTDADGMVYVSLSNPAAGFQIDVFQDFSRTKLVASGLIEIATGSVKLTPQNDSRLSGVVDLAYSANSAAISISAVPAFLSWQWRYLRTLWMQQDHPDNAYCDGTTPVLPIIDPDLIGPDDLRAPFPKANAADPDQAFDLWLHRRTFIDTALSSLQTTREANDLTAILKQVLGDPLPDLDGLLLALTAGVTEVEVESTKASISALGLSVESFIRLMSLRAKDLLAESDVRNEAVSAGEWKEVYSILTQAIKVKQFAAWRTEETNAGVRLGPEHFWPSIREPRQGDWPVIPAEDHPLIDPDVVSLTALPDWLNGKAALQFWNSRRTAIGQIPADLKQEHQINGVDAMLRLALGSPAPGDPLQVDLDVLKSNLTSPDDTIRATAIQQLETDLHLTVASFQRLMVIKAKNDQPAPANKPTAAEWAEVYALLAVAQKLKHDYPIWAQEEKTAGLAYWQALKANLPVWRATPAARQVWQHALAAFSQRPIIDPAVIGADDLQQVIPGTMAFDIWKARYDQVTALRDGLKTAREAEADALTGLDKIILDTLGFEAADLEALDQERQAGRSIQKRAEQLKLADGAFAYLMQIRGLVKSGEPITDAEWNIVYDTLAHAEVERKFATWHVEEQDEGIVLSPDFFKIPATLLTPLPFLDAATPLWLSTLKSRRAWQKTLQTRIDQGNAYLAALLNNIGTVEEATLPILRDALIQATDAVGTSLDDQAEWITQRLLIDAKAAGCQLTTRVAQAIETLQTLVFDLRTGQFKFLTVFPLSLVSDFFDDEWKWIGTYATWRAAMFVYLYPENMLQPSLLKHKTPGFEQLVTRTRGVRLDPRAACEVAETYAQYFRDVCSLEIQATSLATTSMYIGEDCNRQYTNAQSIFYVFAQASNGKIYWSANNAEATSEAYSQTFWKEITVFGEAKVVRIVGAMPYQQTVNDPTTVTGVSVISADIYLFCLVGDAQKQNLKFARLSLDDFGKWAVQTYTLSMPPIKPWALELTPVQTQSSSTRPGLIFRQTGEYRLYYRQLNTDGTDWEQNTVDWPAFYRVFQQFGGVGKIEATLRVNSDLLWFAFRSGYGQHRFELQLIELRTGNSSPGVSRAWYFDGADFLGAVPGPEDRQSRVAAINPPIRLSAVYIFWRDATGSHYKRFTSGDNLDNLVHETLADLIQIPPNSGTGRAGNKMLAFERSKNAQAFYMYKYAESADKLVGSSTIRALPRTPTDFTIPMRLSATELQQRRQDVKNAFMLNADATASVLTYLREAYYFVPLQLALGLQSAGYYIASLDEFRTIYDFEATVGPPNQRNIYYGLELDSKLPGVPVYQQSDDWLLDPLNPDAIAATRRYAFTRFTIISLVQCMLAFADSEFAQETRESLARARTLYLTALHLLNLPELQQNLNGCDDLIAELKVEPGKDIPPEVPASAAAIAEMLTGDAFKGLHFIGEAVKKVSLVLNTAGSWTTKLSEARSVVQAAIASAALPQATGAKVIGQATALQEKHALLITQPGMDNILQEISNNVAVKLLNGLGGNVPANPPSGGAIPIVVPQMTLAAIVTPSLYFCIPPNPMLQSLRMRAEVNLGKLRSCLNIAGIERQDAPYAAPTDTTSGASGQLALRGVTQIRPTLYHYTTLIERARQLVQFAAQAEGMMLTAMLSADQEAYGLLLARQAIDAARGRVRLEDLQLGEANSSIDLATLQRDRASSLIAYADTLLANHSEDIESLRGYISGQGADAQRNFRNSADHQKDDLDFQRSIAVQDEAIGGQQIAIEEAHKQTVIQERAIARLYVSQAQDVLEFLSGKFLTSDLFDWMSGILQDAYRFFLQQACAMARLAEMQLAFERQETPTGYIQPDYWTTPLQSTLLPTNATDQRGLTGSMRLLRDIVELDQYAFITDQRKLQLTRTISLSWLDPLAFQTFRDTGVLRFNTSSELFDRDFPGHYLRLIKRVRVSVIALIPPTEGIRATLTSTGISRVVIGPTPFQTITIRRNPELVPLTSPINATGQFDLTINGDMLLPFEGNGVDMSWELSMPKAANPIDYRTLAEVLFTIEYTALHSFDYRQQVIQALDPNLSADLSFNFTDQFADQWYDLHNPEQTSVPMTVKFRTVRQDFPPNLEALRIQQVFLRFVQTGTTLIEVPVRYLRYKAEGEFGTVGGSATSIDGIISTRRGNAASWVPMIGKSAIGEWELALPNTEDLKNQFYIEEIEDIQFIITYSGQTPEWPST